MKTLWKKKYMREGLYCKEFENELEISFLFLLQQFCNIVAGIKV